MEINLYVVYQNGLPIGAAQAESVEKVVEGARTAMLGQKNPPIMSAKSWHEAPIDDVIRAGLGTLVGLAFQQQAMVAEAMQRRQRPGLIQ